MAEIKTGTQRSITWEDLNSLVFGALSKRPTESSLAEGTKTEVRQPTPTTSETPPAKEPAVLGVRAPGTRRPPALEIKTGTHRSIAVNDLSALMFGAVSNQSAENALAQATKEEVRQPTPTTSETPPAEKPADLSVRAPGTRRAPAFIGWDPPGVPSLPPHSDTRNAPRPPNGMIVSRVEEPLLIVGDLQRDGFKILHSNRQSAQDAFAVSKDRNTFVVCDGMGSYRRSGTLARFLAPLVATNFQPGFIEEPGKFHNFLKELLGEIKTYPSYNDSQEDLDPKLTSRKEGGCSTLSIVHRLGPTTFQCTVAGDSPIIILRSTGEVLPIGIESAGDTDTGIALGIFRGEVSLDVRSTKSHTFTIQPGDKILLASDWIDNVWLSSREGQLINAQQRTQQLTAARTTGTFTNGTNIIPLNPAYEANMLKWINEHKTLATTSKPFQAQVPANIASLSELCDFVDGKRRAPGTRYKADDATLLFIDPKGLPPFKR